MFRPDLAQMVASVVGLRSAIEYILGGFSTPNRRLLKNLNSLATCSGVYAVVSIQPLGNHFSKCCDHLLLGRKDQSKLKEDSCTCFARLNSEMHEPCVHVAQFHNAGLVSTKASIAASWVGATFLIWYLPGASHKRYLERVSMNGWLRNTAGLALSLKKNIGFSEPEFLDLRQCICV